MNPSKDARVNKTLKFSFWDGVFANGMMGFTQDYFVPFFLVLGATVKQVGFLTAAGHLFSSLAQLKSADLAEKFKSRKKMFIRFVFFQALMLIPIAMIALFKVTNPLIFIASVVLFSSFGAIAVPPWASLMSDLVPEDKRGEYFGWRNKILGLLLVSFTFMAGLWLNYMKNFNIFYGFAVLFGCAFIFRVICCHFLALMYEPPLEYDKKHSFTLFDFISRVKESNFAKFVLFVAMFHFSVNLAAPFFSVFMLKELSFSYFLYNLINITATLTIYAMMRRWGRHADQVGNIRVIRLTSKLIAILPLFWLISRNPVFLLFTQVFAGIAWAGFGLATSNFVYDAVSAEKRIRCVAYFNILTSLALATGALLGGFLVNKLPPIFGYNMLTLFLVASILRLIIASSLIRKIKEVRSTDKIKSTQLFFSVIGVKPLLGVDRKAVQLDA